MRVEPITCAHSTLLRSLAIMYILTLLVLAPYSPRYLRVSQNGLNSLLVSWSPPYYRLDIVAGYHISYQEQDGGHRGSVMTEESNLNTTITALIAGATYSISVAANSSTLPSYPTTTTFTLSMCSLPPAAYHVVPNSICYFTLTDTYIVDMKTFAIYWVGLVNYHLKCVSLLTGFNIYQTTVPASVSSVVLTDLHPGTRYNCSIVTTDQRRL